MAMTEALTCPNCGYGFGALQRSTRMFDCPSCGTTLFRAEDALNPLGDHGEMHEVPMLLNIGDHVGIDTVPYHVIGHARFDYGRGWWDEMWAVDGRGRGLWISIDEGDVVVQDDLAEDRWPAIDTPPLLGSTISLGFGTYTVTERDDAACVAIRGELPELLEIGERHAFINATGPDGALLSGEFWQEDGMPQRAWYLGQWLDPFELKVLRA